MLHELLVKMFEGVKSRACPGVGISKVFPQRPIQKHEEVIEAMMRDGFDDKLIGEGLVCRGFSFVLQ